MYKRQVEVVALRRRLLLLFVFSVAQETGDDCPCMLAPSAHSSRAEMIRKAGARAGATGGIGRRGVGAFSPVVNIENPGNSETTHVLFALTFGHGARPAAVAGGAESTYYKLVVLVALVLVVLTLLLVLLLLLLLLLLLVLVLVPTVLSMMALPSPQKVLSLIHI